MVFEASAFILLEFYNRSVPVSLKTKQNFCFSYLWCIQLSGRGGEGSVCGGHVSSDIKGGPCDFFPFTFHISIPWPFNLVPEVLTAGNTLNGNPLFRSY